MRIDDIPACAGGYLKLYLDAFNRGFIAAELKVDISLAEDGRTVLLMADVEEDDPPMASFVLKQATTEDDFFS